MKAIKTIALVLVSLSTVVAQNDIDALRYSFLTQGGTARHMSLGAATGALGADASVLSTNPAGIGVFKKSEFSFTPSIYKSSSTSSFMSSSSNETKYNFNFGNLALIGTYLINEGATDNWVSFNFGFAVNRSTNFHNRLDIMGHSTGNSLIDEYVYFANGTHYSQLDEFSTNLAYQTWLMDTITGSETMYESAPRSGGKFHRKSILTKGAVTEPVITFGGNYGDRFYIGGSLGFPSVRYIEESSYSERFDEDTLLNLQSFDLREDLKTSGNGFNFKLGVIFRPVHFVRLGAAVHTPTFYSLTDRYSKRMRSEFDPGYFSSKNFFDYTTPTGSFSYELTSPMRAIGSIAFIIAEHGFVSAEYEFVDYSESRLRSSKYDFFDENDAIKNKYRAVGNYRFGAEWKLQPYAIRLGYAFYDSPFKNNLNDGSRTSYSAGLGFRDQNYYMDFAYVMTQYSEDYYLYSMVGSAAKTDMLQHHFLFTIGFRY